MSDSMKILKFQAENVRGIKVVEIAPDGDIVTLSGKNGAGKSSVLDSIQATLCGGDLPLRKGAEKGKVEITIGDYVVSRVITTKTDRLIVKNKDGATYPSPREFLEKLVGPMSINPLSFIHLKGRDQLAVLFKLCPELQTGLADVEAKIAAAKQERRDLLRDGQRLRVELEKMPTHSDAPTEFVSLAALTMQLHAAMDANRAIEEMRAGVADQERIHNTLVASVASYEHAVLEAQKKLDDAKSALTDARANLADCGASLSADKTSLAQMDAVDTTIIANKMATAEDANRKLRENQALEAKNAEKSALGARFSAKGKEMEALEAAKSNLLTNSKVPVAGLSVENEEVVFNGISVDQLSTSEKVRVGAAIAVAQNPKAQIILCDDISLLDSTSMKVLCEVCHGFQLWMVANDESGDVGILIEAGEVAAKKVVVEQTDLLNRART